MIIAVTTDTHFGANDKTQRIHQKFIKKLQEETFDVLVHCGDIASHKQKQLYRPLTMFREAFPEKPILIVLGNHDLWSEEWYERRGKQVTYEHMRATQRDWFQELNISYLHDAPYIHKDEVIFYGYDGWYNIIPPPSNDSKWMPPIAKQVPVHTYLRYRSDKALDGILQSAEEYTLKRPLLKKVCVTHHSLTPYRGGHDTMGGNPRHLEFLSENFDLVLNGHSHQEVDEVREYLSGNKVNSIRIVNVGSDYNIPKYKLVTL